MNKYALGKKYGSETKINTLRSILKCRDPKCQNTDGNLFGTVNQDR